MRYEITPPVKDGYAWWTIYDSVEKKEIVMVSTDVSNAESIIKEMFERLIRG